MEKHFLDRQTRDGAQLTIEQIAAICPSAVTEVKDENTGEPIRKINFTTLRQLLGDLAEETPHEVYDFTWVGKTAARREAAMPITDTLRPCPQESVDWENTKNLYIEGDNLKVLKLLQNYYANQIKMIYIDPPYNTGKDFVYHDDFSASQAEYDEAAGNKDELGNRYYVNNDGNGRFHSDWCSMIYARLAVARNLLAEDGVIFISIGEQEIDNLKKICVELFGGSNYVETYIWESTFRPDNSSKILRRNGEYVVCVSKNLKSITKFIGLTKEREGLPSLTKSSMKARILTFPANTVKTYLPDGTYSAGVRDSYELLDDVIVKNGMMLNSFRLNGHMIWGQENLEREIEQGTEIIIKGEGFVPYTKKEGDSQMSPTKLIPNSVVGDILSANAEMDKLFDKKVFSYPKPVTLLKYLTNYIDDKDFIVLDFFSGSSTTAHAVMQLNAEDGGNRKFIMVQLPEDLDENLSNAEEKEKVIVSNAIDLCDKNNKPHILCEVAKERIRRAGKKIKEENPLTTQDLDIGFRVLKLDETNFKQVSFPASEYTQAVLSGLIDNIKEDRTDLDLLFDCMLRWGVELSLPIKRSEADHCQILNVNDGDLVACLDRDNTKITEAVIDAIAAMHPLRIVLLDSAFEEASQKMNIYELFKQRLGWSDDQASKQIRVI